jgi:hypothetical protein
MQESLYPQLDRKFPAFYQAEDFIATFTEEVKVNQSQWGIRNLKLFISKKNEKKFKTVYCHKNFIPKVLALFAMKINFWK